MSETKSFDLQDKSAHISSLNKTPVSIIHEYASKHGLYPKYNLMHNGATMNKITFKYCLELKDYTTVGEGASKKEAKHTAALNLLNEMISNEPDLLKTEFKEWNIENHVVSPFDKTIKENIVGVLNNVCAKNQLKMPEFKLVQEEGQPHAKLFTVSCCVDKMIETATHKTKKQAKQLSAINMIEKINSIVKPVTPDEQVLKTMEEIKNIKFENSTLPLNLEVSNYHLNFKNREWPNPEIVSTYINHYKDNTLIKTDPWKYLKMFVEEADLDLIERFLSKRITDKDYYHLVLSIVNVYPNICTIGVDKDLNVARVKAATETLKHMYYLLL